MITTLLRVQLVRLAQLAMLGLPAAAATAAQLPPDAALRQAIVGSWRLEKEAGIASATSYTTYREDGSASQILRVKVIFKQPMWIWIKQGWTIHDGALFVTSQCSASNSDQAQVDVSTVCRVLLELAGPHLKYRIKDKQQNESRAAALPEEYARMSDELARTVPPAAPPSG